MSEIPQKQNITKSRFVSICWISKPPKQKITKSCFFCFRFDSPGHKKKRCSKKNIFFYHFWILKNHPKTVPSPPRTHWVVTIPSFNCGTSLGTPKTTPQGALWEASGVKNDPSGSDLGGSWDHFLIKMDVRHFFCGCLSSLLPVFESTRPPFVFSTYRLSRR